MIAVIGAVVLLLIAIAASGSRPTRRGDRARRRARRAATDRVLDVMPTVDALGMREAVIAHGQEAVRALIEGYRAHDRAGAMAAIAKCIRQAVQLAILLTAVHLVLHDQVTVGIIFAA